MLKIQQKKSKANHTEEDSSAKEDIAFHTQVAATVNGNLSSTNTICCYLDSGASDHMVNSKEFFYRNSRI